MLPGRGAGPCYWCVTDLLSPTVMSGFSFRKLFSPIPFTFISSSTSFFPIVSLMCMRVNRWCAHHLRPPPSRQDASANALTVCRYRELRLGHAVVTPEAADRAKGVQSPTTRGLQIRACNQRYLQLWLVAA